MTWFKKNKWEILMIILATVMISIPIIIHPYHINDDTIFHLANTIAFSNSIPLNGFFDLRVLPNLARGFGYASGLLYPPLSHMLTGCIYFFMSPFLRITDTFKIFHGILFLGSGLAMYVCALEYTGNNKKVSLIASLLYLTYPYFLSDTYVRDALAESLIFPFLPLILKGIFSLLHHKKKEFYLFFVLGYVGGITAHFTMMMYATIFLGIFLLIYAKEVFKKDFIKPFLIGCIFVIGLTFFYLEGMVEFKLFGNISVFLPNLMSQGVYNTTIFPWLYLPFTGSKKEVNYYFSIMSCLLAVLYFSQRKKIYMPKYSKGLMITFLLSWWMTSPYFFWDLLPSFMYMIQFAWRLLVFVGLFSSLLLANAVGEMKNKYFYMGIVVLILGCSLFDIHYRNDSVYQLSEEETVESDAAIGWQKEYLPVNALDQDYYLHRDDLIHSTEKCTISILKDETPDLKFEVTHLLSSTTIELPRFSYLGYTLTKDNHSFPLITNDKGFIEANIDENGIYELRYTKTKFMNIAKIISMISLISWLFFLYFLRKQS